MIADKKKGFEWYYWLTKEIFALVHLVKVTDLLELR